MEPGPSLPSTCSFGPRSDTFGEGLIAVVLCGLGSDGAAGARRVKEAGGTVVIQNPRTAPYPSMPQALAPTIVDVIADADAMGPLLATIYSPAPTPPRARGMTVSYGLSWRGIRTKSGIDFSQYKMPTIQRRLQRRLVATGAHTLEEYRPFLDQHPAEYGRLVNAFLIKVTEFFRDADLFQYSAGDGDSRPGRRVDASVAKNCGFGARVAPPARSPTRWHPYSRRAGR